MNHKVHPLPARLKKARVEAGLSQKKLGILAGIDEFSASPRINQYERGRHLPDYLTVVRLAAVLGVPVPYFYTCDDRLACMIRLWGLLPEAEVEDLLARYRG